MGLKYKVNESFFDTWSHEMAYVLGFMYADGSLENAPSLRGKYVRVTNTDLDRILLIKTFLRSDHTVFLQPVSPKHKKKYLLRIGSHALFDSLVKRGVTPNKSFTMKFPQIPRTHLSFFVLGYFDGDGCAHLSKSKGEIKSLRTIFTSGSKSFLTSLHSCLIKEVGMSGRGLYTHGSSKGTFQLRYSTRDSIRLFRFMYQGVKNRKIALRRKYVIFTEYFNKRGISTKDFDRVLKTKGPVAKKLTRRSAKPLYEGANPSRASIL